MSAPTDPREPGPVDPAAHGEWDALAVGWALSALDPEDEARFAGHLTGCDRCTATVRESLYTVADMAYAQPDEAPPPALKSRIMAAVAAEPRRSRAAGAAPAPVATQVADDRQKWPLWPPHPGVPGDRPASSTDEDWFARSDRPVRGPGDLGGHTGLPGTQPRTEPPYLELPHTEPPDTALPRTDRLRPDRLRESEDRPSPEQAGAYRPGDPTDRPGADRSAYGPGGPADQVRPADRRIGGAEWLGEHVATDPSGSPADPEPSFAGARGRHAAPDDDRGTGDRATVVPLDSRRRRSWLQRSTVAAAAAAVVALIAGLAVWNADLRSDRENMRQVVAQRDELRQIVAQRDAAIARFASDGPARVAALASTKAGQPRRATIVVRGSSIEIITETLPSTTGQVRYWLWTLRCDAGKDPSDLKPIRGFTLSQSAFSVRTIGSDPAFADAPCFAISQEVGTATPTTPTDVVALGQPS